MSVICSHLAPLAPIIDGVGAMALSLFAFRVDITLLTDGGQTVTLYTVSGHLCGCIPSPTVGIRYIQECIYVVYTHTHHCMYPRYSNWMLLPSQVEVKGVNYTGIVESSQQSQVSVLVNQLDQNFTKGESHTVRVFVTNSVGSSNPLPTLLRVPCELPNV